MSTASDILIEINRRTGGDRVNVYPAINDSINMISKRLLWHGSSLIKGDLSVSVAASESVATMPDDFWGLTTKPYISGETSELIPLPDQKTRLLYTSDATPIYYKLAGSTLSLIPGTSSAITICGEYWVKPTSIAKPSDTLPYNGLFDDTIKEFVIFTHSSDRGVNDLMLMRENINRMVDDIVPHLEKKAPERFEDNLFFDAMAIGDWL